MIEWSEQYSTGIDDIDKQHRALFKFFAILEKNIKKGDPSIIQESIRFMKTYMQEHFKFEEMCMFGTNCREAENNLEAHKEFEIKLKEFEQKIKESSEPLKILLEMTQFVEQWLINHIQKVDLELKARWKFNPQAPEPTFEQNDNKPMPIT